MVARCTCSPPVGSLPFVEHPQQSADADNIISKIVLYIKFGMSFAIFGHKGWSVKITDSFIFDMFYTSFCLFSVCTPYAQ